MHPQPASPRDYFSSQAAEYARYRPSYPPVLYDFVAGLTTRHGVVWDCATGSGQAVAGLAARFERVVATDISAAQLAQARPQARVEYRVASADASGLRARSVDVVTVGQALHWLDLERFYTEVRRVLAPGGALAVWSYGDPVLDDPLVDAPLQQFNHDTMAPYWPVDRGRVGELYRTYPFPFAEVAAPILTLECAWTLAELAGYLRSWSATARYVATHGTDPVIAFERALGAMWRGPAVRRIVRWPLTVRAGRVIDRR
jgi:SAM-dependent methyltransferase